MPANQHNHATEPEPLTNPEWDAIDQAGWESFPASDPPAVSAAAVSAATVGAGQVSGPDEAPPLSEAERHALLEALDHAYRAWAALDQHIRSFGNDPKLAEVLASQLERLEKIRDLFRRYGLEVPEQGWEIRETAVAAEQAAHGIYTRLVHHADADVRAVVHFAKRGDVKCVFEALLLTSESRHLPILLATRHQHVIDPAVRRA